MSRVEVRASVEVAAAEDGAVGKAVVSQLRDLCVRGATLNHPAPIKPGSHVVLKIDPLRLIGEVVHCKCFRDGSAMVGVEFLGVLDATSAGRRKAG